MKPHHNGLYIPVSNIYGGVFLQKLLTNKIHEIFLQKGSIIDDTQCSKFACASFFFSLHCSLLKHIQDIYIVYLLFTFHLYCVLFLLGQVYQVVLVLKLVKAKQ